MDNAKKVALVMVSAAREHGFMNEQLTLIPDLAEVEKVFFVETMKRLQEQLVLRKKTGLELDEISSLFTFVFARSVESVTNYINDSKQEFEFLGMLDGKVPFASDERIIGYFKSLDFAGVMATAYVDWAQTQESEADFDPFLSLFEALKWTWRVTQHLAASFVEKL